MWNEITLTILGFLVSSGRAVNLKPFTSKLFPLAWLFVSSEIVNSFLKILKDNEFRNQQLTKNNSLIRPPIKDPLNFLELILWNIFVQTILQILKFRHFQLQSNYLTTANQTVLIKESIFVQSNIVSNVFQKN